MNKNREKSVPPVVLLDLDDVLVDFVGAACALFGMPAPARHSEWNLCSYLHCTEERFCAAIDAEGPEFWAGLEAHPWMESLLEFAADRSAGHFAIVTNPGGFRYSMSGKRAWLAQTFGKDFDHWVFTSRKHYLANPSTVLIDDHPENVNSFRSFGGKAVVFPAHGNAFWKVRLQQPSPTESVLHHVETFFDAN